MRLITLVLLALNLRPAVTSVPPLVGTLRTELHMANGTLAVLTALPLLTFGVFSLVVPIIVRARGPEKTLAWAVGMLALALVARTASGTTTLLIGTAVAATAIAILNVLIPGVIRRDHHEHVGLAMGLYAMALGVGASAGAAAAVPIQDMFGKRWQPALAVWAAPALLALWSWLAVVRRHRAPVAQTASRVANRMFRQPLAWTILIFLGVQSLVFFTLIAWLPAFFQDIGYSPAKAGLLLAVAQLAGIPGGLIVPQLAMRSHNQIRHVIVTTMLTAVGLAGLAFAPTSAPWVWSVAVGLGSTAFPLGLTLLVLRAGSAAATDSLSGFAQSGAYMIATLGPLLAGALREATGDWQVPMLVLLVLLVPQIFAGILAGRDRLV